MRCNYINIFMLSFVVTFLYNSNAYCYMSQASVLSSGGGNSSVSNYQNTSSVGIPFGSNKPASAEELVLWAGFLPMTEVIEPVTPPGCALDLDISTFFYDSVISMKDIDPSLTSGVNSTIDIAIVAQNTTNLDTYEVVVSFDPSRLEFVGGFEDNPFGGIYNHLKSNGGDTIGFQAIETSPGLLNISNSLIYQNTNEAPEGSGVIALLRFKVLDNEPNNNMILESANFVDSFGNNLLVENTSNGSINPGTVDTDGDGLSDADEVNIHHTDPKNPDSDGDGVNDGDEVAAGTDPNDPLSRPAPDGFNGVAINILLLQDSEN